MNIYQLLGISLRNLLINEFFRENNPQIKYSLLRSHVVYDPFVVGMQVFNFFIFLLQGYQKSF